MTDGCRRVWAAAVGGARSRVLVALLVAAILLFGCQDGAETSEPSGEETGSNGTGEVTCPDPGPGEPRWEPQESDEPEPEPVPVDPGPGSGLAPNELGSVMILMYHDLGEGEGEWRRSRENFRRDLEYLWENGYRPVSLSDYLSGAIDLPEGMSPVILTFDDGLSSQLAWRDGEVGEPEPDTAVGMLLEFSDEHPGFDPRAVLYINSPRPFFPLPEEDIPATLQWLVEQGFELGNHTHYHANLRERSDAEVMRAVALTEAMITGGVPEYPVRSLSLPYGLYPRDRELAHRGAHEGVSYEYDAVLLVGAQPAPSPFSLYFAPLQLPRVQASTGELDKWYSEMQDNPLRRYVSDGDPAVVTVPVQLEDRLDEEALGSRSVRLIESE